MDELLTPNIAEVTKQTERASRIVLEPLERGFGHTLGNALRRVLLSSIPGCAVVEARIEGVLHEYTVVEGVREGVVDILLNLKELAVRMFHKNEMVVTLKKKGPGAATGADIEGDGDFEIANPEHVIAHLDDNGSLEMTLTIRKGRGYQPSARLREETTSPGSLLLDASFSPIRRVAYRVENARVEQRTDLDKLVVELETNGTVDPQDAVREAAAILHSQLSAFVDLERLARDRSAKEAQEMPPILMHPIDELSLSLRATNCLKAERIMYIGDLVQHSKEELLKTPNFGRKALQEIEAALQEHELELGADLPNWPPPELRQRRALESGAPQARMMSGARSSPPVGGRLA